MLLAGVFDFACNNDGVSDELIAARHTKACRPDAATFLVWQEWSPIQQGDNCASSVLPDDSWICNDILHRSAYVTVLVCIQVWDVFCCKRFQSLSLGCVTHPSPVVQHNGCVAVVWDVTVLCLQSLGCVVLQMAKGYVLTGHVYVSSRFPVQTFSAKYKKWYVLVGIDMYCVCIGMYLYVFYGA